MELEEGEEGSSLCYWMLKCVGFSGLICLCGGLHMDSSSIMLFSTQ